jgi:small multidrug resistance pump
MPAVNWAWALLGAAIVFEIAGTTCLKLSAGFTQLVPSLLIAPLYLVSFALMTFAVKEIPISVAYAVWSGVGTALIAGIGMVVFREPGSLLKVLFIVVIIAGVVGLHLADRMAGPSS